MKGLVTLLIFLGSISSAYASTVLPIELDVITEVNLARTSNSLNALAFDNILFEGSRFHAEDMSTTGSLSHSLSDGTTFIENYRNFGYATNEHTANIIAQGFSDASSLVAALMNSQGHRDIILNEGTSGGLNWEGIGVGWSNGYWSIGFGTANPVPVPAAVWLFGSGLIGLISIARRKKT